MSEVLHRESLAERVSALLREYIDTSDLKIGDRLDSESVLCSKFNVSRTTIREALRMLQAIDYVMIEPNKGAYIADKNRGESSALNSWFLKNAGKLEQIYEVRMIIEPEIAALATERGTQDDKIVMMGALAIFEEQIKADNLAGCTTYDEYFHNAIAKATHNDVLVEIMKTISNPLRAFRSHTFTLPSVKETTVLAHTKIADAIMSGDVNAAREAMRTHIEEYADVSEELSTQK